jgi:hypothetical protein
MAYDASWTKRDTRRTIRRSLDWLARFDDEVRPFLSSQAHQNFTDRTLRDWRTAYYGDAYPRLQAIKRAVDPDGVFRFPQAVERAPAAGAGSGSGNPEGVRIAGRAARLQRDDPHVLDREPRAGDRRHRVPGAVAAPEQPRPDAAAVQP